MENIDQSEVSISLKLSLNKLICEMLIYVFDLFQSYISLNAVFNVIFCIFLLTVLMKAVEYLSNHFNDFGNGITLVDPHMNGVHYSVSYWTERGGRRSQEDHFLIKKRAWRRR